MVFIHEQVQAVLEAGTALTAAEEVIALHPLDYGLLQQPSSCLLAGGLLRPQATLHDCQQAEQVYLGQHGLLRLFWLWAGSSCITLLCFCCGGSSTLHDTLQCINVTPQCGR